ncbi:hypothetical protein D3C80_2078760 [compost metagenome]
MGQHMFLRVRSGAKGPGIRALALEEQRRIALGGVGGQPREDIQQFRDPGAGACGGEAQGNQVPFAQCPLEGLV